MFKAAIRQVAGQFPNYGHLCFLAEPQGCGPHANWKRVARLLGELGL